MMEGNLLYVANLGAPADRHALERLFAPYGRVVDVPSLPFLGTDGRDAGFALVEMGDRAGGEAAIAALDGRAHAGHVLAVGWATAVGAVESTVADADVPGTSPPPGDGSDDGTVPTMPSTDPAPSGPVPGGFGDRSGGGRRGSQFHVQ